MQNRDWLEYPLLEGEDSLFQAIIKRTATHQTLVDSVLEVARYVDTLGLRTSWGLFVKQCPNIPKEILSALVDEGWGWWVVHRNQDLPRKVLKALAEDDKETRQALASRKQNIPKKVLKSLSKDKARSVRRGVAKRKQKLPKSILRSLAKDEEWTVRIIIANREQTLPEDILKALAQDDNPRVRESTINRKAKSNVASPIHVRG